MLKRSWPRFSTASSTGNGSSLTVAVPTLPVKNAASSCSVPRATVPSTSGRALPPSVKNAVPRSPRYFGWWCMSWRQPAALTIEIAATHSEIARSRAARLPPKGGSHEFSSGSRAPRRPACVASGFSRKFSVRDLIDVPRTQALEKVGRAEPIELRIRRFDGQEEALLAADLHEARHVEHRVIRHRQAAQEHPAEHRGKRREQDRHFEGDRDERRPAVERA